MQIQRNFMRKILSLRAGREREVSQSLMMTITLSTVQPVMPMVGYFGLTILRTVEF